MVNLEDGAGLPGAVGSPALVVGSYAGCPRRPVDAFDVRANLHMETLRHQPRIPQRARSKPQLSGAPGREHDADLERLGIGTHLRHHAELSCERRPHLVVARIDAARPRSAVYGRHVRPDPSFHIGLREGARRRLPPLLLHLLLPMHHVLLPATQHLCLLGVARRASADTSRHIVLLSLGRIPEDFVRVADLREPLLCGIGRVRVPVRMRTQRLRSVSLLDLIVGGIPAQPESLVRIEGR
mmetsp:Transcript_2410/g.7241  ORF Transcript_2410/g.7241 Transcript_2410/m.7241 type:complete len:240 (+) Transcript_2410:193-912(+)